MNSIQESRINEIKNPFAGSVAMRGIFCLSRVIPSGNGLPDGIRTKFMQKITIIKTK